MRTGKGGIGRYREKGEGEEEGEEKGRVGKEEENNKLNYRTFVPLKVKIYRAVG